MEMRTGSQTARAILSGSKGVVLLVEDESAVREITAQVLESGGYRVLQASGARDALHQVATNPGNIDLLLTDVVMPEMNGITLAEQVGQLRPNVVTVFMSGYAQAEIMRKATAQSAMHIQKPFTVKSLLARIAEALKDGTRGTDPQSGVRVAAPCPSEAMPVMAACQTSPTPALE